MQKMKPYEFTGVLVWCDEVRSFGQNGFRKREIVLCSDPDAQFPNCVAFDLKSGKKDLTLSVTEQDKGATFTVRFYPEARAWDDQKTGRKRWFSSNSVVEVIRADAASPAPEPASAPESVPASDPDNLPF